MNSLMKFAIDRESQTAQNQARRRLEQRRKLDYKSRVQTQPSRKDQSCPRRLKTKAVVNVSVKFRVDAPSKDLSALADLHAKLQEGIGEMCKKLGLETDQIEVNAQPTRVRTAT